jgi:hypothetical protein
MSVIEGRISAFLNAATFGAPPLFLRAVPARACKASRTSRTSSTLIGHIEKPESAEPDKIESDAREEEAVIEEGPKNRFVRADVEETMRRRTLNIIVQLCNIADEDDFEELTVFSIAKARPIAYDYIEQRGLI